MALTRIQLMSDLHLEIERGDEMDYERFDIPPVAPILALLGDIGVVQDERLFVFIRGLLRKFETVLYVLGNHESYRSTYEETIEKLEAFEAKITGERSQSPNLGEFVFLNRKAWSPSASPNLVILGCTLWTQLNAEDLDILSWSMTDFKEIKGMTPKFYDELHIRDCRWLEDELGDPASREKKVVVFTHHVPVIKGGSDPKFSGPNIPTSSGFVTDMQSRAPGLDLAGRPRGRGVLLAPPVCIWAFGHTHWCCDFVITGDGDVRIVSNQRGYREGKENRAQTFSKEFVLAL